MIKNIIIFLLLFLNLLNIQASKSDPNIQIIRNYYSYLSNRDTIKNAYDMSPKKVNYEKYYSWYKDVEIISPYEYENLGENKYKFKVFLMEHNDEGPKEYVFEVIMEIKNNKIISSKSKNLDSYIEKTYDYKDSKKIIVKHNIKNQDKTIYITDKNLKIIEEIKSFGSGPAMAATFIEYKFYNGDFIFFNYSGYDIDIHYCYNEKSKKIYEIPFYELYESENKKYIIAQGEETMSTEAGKRLIIFENKYYGIDLDPNETIGDIEIEKKNNKKYLIFKGKYGDEIKRIEVKK